MRRGKVGLWKCSCYIFNITPCGFCAINRVILSFRVVQQHVLVHTCVKQKCLCTHVWPTFGICCKTSHNSVTVLWTSTCACPTHFVQVLTLSCDTYPSLPFLSLNSCHDLLSPTSWPWPPVLTLTCGPVSSGSRPLRVPIRRMTLSGWPTGWSTGSSVWGSSSPTSSSTGSPSTMPSRWVACQDHGQNPRPLPAPPSTPIRFMSRSWLLPPPAVSLSAVVHGPFELERLPVPVPAGGPAPIPAPPGHRRPRGPPARGAGHGRCWEPDQRRYCITSCPDWLLPSSVNELLPVMSYFLCGDVGSAPSVLTTLMKNKALVTPTTSSTSSSAETKGLPSSAGSEASPAEVDQEPRVRSANVKLTSAKLTLFPGWICVEHANFLSPPAALPGIGESTARLTREKNKTKSTSIYIKTKQSHKVSSFLLLSQRQKETFLLLFLHQLLMFLLFIMALRMGRGFDKKGTTHLLSKVWRWFMC